MKKLMILVAVLAMLLVVVVPALAQGGNTGNLQNSQQFADPVAEQGFEQESESGDIGAEFSASNTGDNSNICAPALQFGNTGNLQNQQGVLQYGSVADDVEFEAEDQMVFEPSLETECSQDVQQSSAASSN